MQKYGSFRAKNIIDISKMFHQFISKKFECSSLKYWKQRWTLLNIFSKIYNVFLNAKFVSTKRVVTKKINRNWYMLMAEIQSLRIFIRKHDWRNSRINVRILNYNEVNNIPKMEIAYPGLRYQVKISSSLPYNIFCLHQTRRYDLWPIL